MIWSRKGAVAVYLASSFALAVLMVVLVVPEHGFAAINQQINFQGKLTNPDGTNVTDGSYSLRFRIYTDPTADTGACASTCKWEETQGTVSVSSGNFQVAHGSSTALPGSVDFNGNALYLGVKIGADAEMTPRIRFTASPYAFNALNLDGLASTSFVQLAQGTQTDSSITNPSISINKTGATAAIFQLQRNGVDVLSVANDGSATFKNATDSTIGFSLQNAAGSSVLVADTTAINNIVSNMNFEVNATGWAYSGTPGSVARNTTEKYVGTASLAVVTTANTNNGARYVTGNSAPTQLSTSTTYTISWFSKLLSGTFTDIIAAYARNGAAETNCTGINAQTVSTSGWTKHTCTITTDGTPPAANAYIVIKQTAATARTFYIDGVQIEIGSVATAFKETGLSFNGLITSPVSFKNQSDSTAAFNIQDSAGNELFQVDSLNNRLYVGDPTADATGVLLVFDSKNTAGDPTGVNGGTYYNSSTNKFRCFQNSVWEDCITNTKVTLASDQTNLNGVANTMEDVTGLSWTVAANTDYYFECTIWYTSAVATTGSRWALNGPATTALVYQSEYSLTTTTSTRNATVTAYDSPAASNATSATTGSNIVVIIGFIRPSAGGTVIVRHASEVGGSTITARAGSNCQIW